MAAACKHGVNCRYKGCVYAHTYEEFYLTNCSKTENLWKKSIIKECGENYLQIYPEVFKSKIKTISLFKEEKNKTSVEKTDQNLVNNESFPDFIPIPGGVNKPLKHLKIKKRDENATEQNESSNIHIDLQVENYTHIPMIIDRISLMSGVKILNVEK